MELTHGGDWAGYRAKFGRDALDFSANVSPLGLPEGVALAIVNALPTADRYPDPLCRELRQHALAARDIDRAEVHAAQHSRTVFLSCVPIADEPHHPAFPPPGTKSSPPVYGGEQVYYVTYQPLM